MANSLAPFTSAADLHVHTKYSDRPSEWILRRVGTPECFVEPEEVYRRAVAAGMDFVTVSDHNKIDGALDIAHYLYSYISDEFTPYFAEYGEKMHIVVQGITEAQFRDIQKARQSIYDFRQYVLDHDIVYSVAHPLFLVNERLTTDQFEKLLVMFNRFELINGTRDPRASKLVKAIFNALDEPMLERLADKHGIEPVGPTPHRKMLTAGSDDHSGLYVASAHTVTPRAATVEEFIEHLRQGRHEPAGESGSSIHLAHCFYSIAYAYYKNKILPAGDGSSSLVGEMLKRLLEPPKPQPKLTAAGRLRGYVGGWIWKRRKKSLSSTELMLVEEFTSMFARDNRPLRSTSGQRSVNGGPNATEAFEISCRLAHQIGYAFLRRVIDKAGTGDIIKTLESAAALAPVAASIAPYLAAFTTQHKDERFMKQIARHFDLDAALHERGAARAWVTDTFDDINGVTRTIRTLAMTAHHQQRPLEVLTCVPEPPLVDFALKNFDPVGQFALPEYPSQKVSFPPFLEIFEYIERRKFRELIISTPGPMGLTALAAAKMLRLKTIGVYHTDFPSYIQTLTEDDTLAALTWRVMAWFYEHCDTILVPSDYYRRYLIEHGFSGDKIRILRRGVEPERFNPEKRVDDCFARYGAAADRLTYLYVGRISLEKNVDLLIEAFDKVTERGVDAQLVLIGDGPAYDALRQRTRHNERILFTGFLEGEPLHEAYASADVFVFPSTTDTFGNVVLEAQASGLPAIVSDRGGPQEIVQLNDSGLIVDLSDTLKATDALADAMATLYDEPARREQMREAALATARQMSWPVVLQHLFDSGEPTRPSLPSGALLAADEQPA